MSAQYTEKELLEAVSARLLETNLKYPYITGVDREITFDLEKQATVSRLMVTIATKQEDQPPKSKRVPLDMREALVRVAILNPASRREIKDLQV